jgi:hypothetical protein
MIRQLYNIEICDRSREAVALLEASLIDCRNPFFLLFFIIDDKVV